MAISGGAAISQALLQLGVYDPGELPSASEQNACLLIANQLLSNWYNEQVQAMTVLLSGQNKAGQVYINGQAHIAKPFSDAYTLAAGTYVAPVFTSGTYTPGAAPAFADLTTPITLPTGYELALVLNLAVKLAPQYLNQASPDLGKSAMDALSAAAPVPGRMPVIGGGIQGVESPAAGTQAGQ